LSGAYSRGRPRTKGAHEDGFGAQRALGGLAMAAEQFDQWGDQLALVLAPGAEVAPAQLEADLLTGVLAHRGGPGFGNTPF